MVSDKRRRIANLAAVAEGARSERLVKRLVQEAAVAREQAARAATPPLPMRAMTADEGDSMSVAFVAAVERVHESSGPVTPGDRMAALRGRIAAKQQLAPQDGGNIGE